MFLAKNSEIYLTESLSIETTSLNSQDANITNSSPINEQTSKSSPNSSPISHAKPPVIYKQHSLPQSNTPTQQQAKNVQISVTKNVS